MTDSIPSITVAEVEAELDKIDATASRPLRNLGLLVLSLALFAGASRLHSSAEYVTMLVIVVFIHETGHWLGMKMFGYHDVKMFFIPFFGAAVSGKQRNPSGGAQAIVSLLGPAPGIIIGLAAAIFSGILHQPLLMKYAWISVGINLLNMLPIFPLDGGRFFEAVLFSRYSFMEVVFRLLAVLALGWVAWFLSSILLGMLALLTLIAARETYLTGKISGRFKKHYPASLIPEVNRVPHEQLEQLMPDLALGFQGKNVKPKFLAMRAQNVWQKIRRKSPGFWASFAMLACYAGVIVVALIAGFILLVSLRRVAVVQRSTEDGKTATVQETYWGKYKIEEAQLDSQGFYNGPAISWSAKGGKQQEGYYDRGYKEGDWKLYDVRGGLHATVRYVARAPVYYGIYQGDELVEVPRGEWPDSVKNFWVYPKVSEARDPRDLQWFTSTLKQRIMDKIQKTKPAGAQ